MWNLLIWIAFEVFFDFPLPAFILVTAFVRLKRWFDGNFGHYNPFQYPVQYIIATAIYFLMD